MCADSKTVERVGILKFGSAVQKIFNIENSTFYTFFLWSNGSYRQFSTLNNF